MTSHKRNTLRRTRYGIACALLLILLLTALSTVSWATLPGKNTIWIYDGCYDSCFEQSWFDTILYYLDEQGWSGASRLVHRPSAPDIPTPGGLIDYRDALEQGQGWCFHQGHGKYVKPYWWFTVEQYETQSSRDLAYLFYLLFYEEFTANTLEKWDGLFGEEWGYYISVSGALLATWSTKNIDAKNFENMFWIFACSSDWANTCLLHKWLLGHRAAVTDRSENKSNVGLVWPTMSGYEGPEYRGSNEACGYCAQQGWLQGAPETFGWSVHIAPTVACPVGGNPQIAPAGWVSRAESGVGSIEFDTNMDTDMVVPSVTIDNPNHGEIGNIWWEGGPGSGHLRFEYEIAPDLPDCTGVTFGLSKMARACLGFYREPNEPGGTFLVGGMVVYAIPCSAPFLVRYGRWWEYFTDFTWTLDVWGDAD